MTFPITPPLSSGDATGAPSAFSRDLRFDPSSSSVPPPLNQAETASSLTWHFASRDTAHSCVAGALIAPRSKQGCSCISRLETLPFALARRTAVLSDHVGCHASRSMRQRIWRNNGPVTSRDQRPRKERQPPGDPGGCLPAGGCGGPQPLAGKPAAPVQLRNSDLMAAMGPTVAAPLAAGPQSGPRAIEPARCIRSGTCGAWCLSPMLPTHRGSRHGTWPSGRQAL